MSPDPLTVHGAGADLNAYAYVHGKLLGAADAAGLDETTGTSDPNSIVDVQAAEAALKPPPMAPRAGGKVAPFRPPAPPVGHPLHVPPLGIGQSSEDMGDEAAAAAARGDYASAVTNYLGTAALYFPSMVEDIAGGTANIPDQAESAGEHAARAYTLASEGQDGVVGEAADAVLSGTASLVGAFSLYSGMRETIRAVPQYNRRMYGGAATKNAAGKQIVQEAEGKPCPGGCGNDMVRGTETQASPQHDPQLEVHFYLGGGWRMSQAQRVAYANSAEAFNGALCLTCQRTEGGIMRSFEGLGHQMGTSQKNIAAINTMLFGAGVAEGGEAK